MFGRRVVHVRFSANKRNRRIRDIMVMAYYGSPNIFLFYPLTLSLLNRQLHKGIQKVQEFMHKMQYEKKIR